MAISITQANTNIDIYNIYNPPDTDMTLWHLQSWLSTHPTRHDSSTIWAGDFNKHNPLWSGPNQAQQCRRSDTDLFMQLLAQYHMELQLPAGTPTFQSDSHHTWTTLDLLFCDSDLTHCIQSCDASPDDHLPAADHLPIHTWINVELNKRHTTPGCNFRNTDWAKFQQPLTENLTQSGLGNALLPSNPPELDGFVDQLTTAIQIAIKANIPILRPTPYSKPWWNPSLTQLHHNYACKSRDEFQARFTASWEESKCASNHARKTYISVLHKAKAEHWKGWIEEAKEKDVWIAGKYAKNPLSDRSRTCIPTLFKKGADGQVTSELHTDAEKAALFTDLFFLPCPHNLPGSPEDSDPNPPPLKFTTPAPHQITCHINKTNPFKAPGEDGIPNLVLKKCEALLTPLLHTCLLEILNTGYFPKRWHSWKTIVLRKPGKPDYTIAKAYCLIALYDTMGKVLSGVMTDITVYLFWNPSRLWC